MIKKLTLRNFQAHHDSVLEFAPGVNVIIGSTDSGKSSIIRAIRKVCKNRPLGDAYRSHWGGDTEITLELSDGMVSFKKGAEEGYHVGDLHFKAFKTDVPDEVITALNMNDVNLQSQLDRPFLLENSAGEVAAHFNRIANLSSIDKVRSNLKSESTSNSDEIKRLTTNIDKASKELITYDYLDKVEKEVEVLEDLVKMYLKNVNQLNDIKIIIVKIYSIETDLKLAAIEIKAEEVINKLLNLLEQINTITKQKQAIESIIENIKEYDELIEHDTSIDVLKTINNALNILGKADELNNQKQLISTLLINHSNTIELITKYQKELQKLQKEWDEDFPNICPLCDSIIKKSKHNCNE